jgi:hypothetical protein
VLLGLLAAVVAYFVGDVLEKFFMWLKTLSTADGQRSTAHLI